MPTESLTVADDTSNFFNCSRVQLKCDDKTGYDTVDSTPPKLAAKYHNFKLFMNRSAGLPPPFTSIEIIIPKPLICRFANSWPSFSGSPGYITRTTLLCP